jgi:RNA polymerase sigma-70 factor (ECF subfamily)
LSQYCIEAILGAWIKAILIRKAHRSSQQTPAYLLMETLPKDTSSVDWGNDAIDAAYLEKPILNLPEGARAIFVLIEVEGYTHREAEEWTMKFIRTTCILPKSFFIVFPSTIISKLFPLI